MANFQLKGNSYHTNGNLPQTKDMAPPIRGIDKDLKEKTWLDFPNGKKILCFVPSIDTPVCLESAKKFNEAISKKLGVMLLYLSMDLPFAFKRACLSGDDPMKHISFLSLFRSKDCAENYGVLIQDGPLSGLCARAVFIVDEHQKLIYSELVEEISHEPNYHNALNCI